MSAKGSRLPLPQALQLTLPKTCPVRGSWDDERGERGDPCREAKLMFEERLAGTAGGFTAFDCEGVWHDGERFHFDQNTCYLVSTTPSKARAITEWYSQAIEAAGESAGYVRKGNRATITSRRGKQIQRVLA